MLPLKNATLPLIFVIGLTACTAPEPKREVNLLHGTWIQTDDAECKEQITFGADGTISVRSRDELLSGTYTSVRISDAQLYAKVTRIISQDNGGLDCGNSTRNEAGRTNAAYAFLDGHATLQLCFDQERRRCFGRFSRK
jgi:prepilin-type processing-associated H-X9-DG protein